MGMNQDELNALSDEEIERQGFNRCDKCNAVERTNTLIWITSEDFEPKENEIIPEDLYSKYDCLCESCYLEEITIKTKGFNSNKLANAFYDEDYTYIEFITKERPTNQVEAEKIINNYIDNYYENKKEDQKSE